MRERKIPIAFDGPHRLADLSAPTDDERVRAVVRGIRRTIGTARAPRAPATSDRLLAMVASHSRTRAALRDRALLLLGFAGAFRRSELVALDLNDVEETAEGLRIMIRRSKTDQEGAGATVAIVRGAVACPGRGVEGVAQRSRHYRGRNLPEGEQGQQGSA